MRTVSPLARGWLFAVFYTLFVILFGAVVRITGSGAGCGQHWPTCHGEVAHLPQSTETFIELCHRLTSGLSMVLVFGLTYFTLRSLPARHGARSSALWASAFMITEALLGAGLVLLELVGKNDSVSRALVMALHLLNTAALLLTMVGAAFLTRFPERLRLGLFLTEGSARRATEGHHESRFWQLHVYWVGALLMLLVAAAGAVTALGDTVYPVGQRSSLEVAEQLTKPGAHFLEHLRGVHPIVASLAAGFWVMAGARLVRPWGQTVVILTLLQVAVGVLNIYLSAPGWMQVIHLALFNLLWLAWALAWLERYPSVLSSKESI